MTVVPTGVSQVVLASEFEKATSWIARRGWRAKIGGDGLTLDVHMAHPADGGELLLRGRFDGYRAIPPLWNFLDPASGNVTADAWPAPGPVGGGSSIFHSLGVICAHFSRTGFEVQGGPHEWGGLTNWTAVDEGVHAETVAEMLSVFHTHLRHSPGRLG